MPYREILAAWLRGFRGDRNLIYDFEKYPHDAYLSDYERNIKTRKIDMPHQNMIDDKLVFDFIISALNTPTPRLYAAQLHESFVSFSEYPDLESLLEAEKNLVIKPRFGSGGDRVRFVSHRDSLLINGQPARDLRLSPNDLVVGLVEQHPYATQIFPGATNTMRLLTIWDYEDDQPFICFAVHRFGTFNSAPLDGWNRGGLSARIDLQTGQMGSAVLRPTLWNPKKPARGSLANAVVWCDRHPDTGQQIEGVQVPHWESVRSAVIAAAAQLRFLPYIGWDVIVTERDLCVIEANSRTDVHFLQVHDPFLIDERTARFFEKHGVSRSKAGPGPRGR